MIKKACPLSDEVRNFDACTRSDESTFIRWASRINKLELVAATAQRLSSKGVAVGLDPHFLAPVKFAVALEDALKELKKE